MELSAGRRVDPRPLSGSPAWVSGTASCDLCRSLSVGELNVQRERESEERRDRTAETRSTRAEWYMYVWRAALYVNLNRYQSLSPCSYSSRNYE
jgi:hypothetical protein